MDRPPCSTPHPSFSSASAASFCARYPIPCKQIKKYCQEILQCLAYLHSEVRPDQAGAAAGAEAAEASSATDDPRAKPKAKVMHRDIKCDNIFIQGSGIKIGDLGLATTDGRR